MSFTNVFSMEKPSQGVYRFDTALNNALDIIDLQLSTHTHIGSSYTTIPLAGLDTGAFALSPSCSMYVAQSGYQQYCFRAPTAVTLNEVYGSLRDSTPAGATLNVACYAGSTLAGTLAFPPGLSHNTQILTGLNNAMGVGDWSRIQITSNPGGNVYDLNVVFLLKKDLVARG